MGEFLKAEYAVGPPSAPSRAAIAKQYLSDLCFGRTVNIDDHGKGRYGRTLGEVFVDGQSINAAMVEAGYAWHYKKYSDDEQLAELEDQAKQTQVGLWRDTNPLPPWEWRKLSS